MLHFPLCREKVTVMPRIEIQFEFHMVFCFGTCLVLFPIFINDPSEDLSSRARLFADDCIPYREITSEANLKNTMYLCFPLPNPIKKRRVGQSVKIFFFLIMNSKNMIKI